MKWILSLMLICSVAALSFGCRAEGEIGNVQAPPVILS
jgi:hypothetical protein